jgi:hypothetical protein
MGPNQTILTFSSLRIQKVCKSLFFKLHICRIMVKNAKLYLFLWQGLFKLHLFSYISYLQFFDIPEDREGQCSPCENGAKKWKLQTYTANCFTRRFVQQYDGLPTPLTMELDAISGPPVLDGGLAGSNNPRFMPANSIKKSFRWEGADNFLLLLKFASLQHA